MRETFRTSSTPTILNGRSPSSKRSARGETDSVSFEERMRRKDGSIFFVSADVKGVRKPDGTLDYLFVTGQDITERKMHEIALSIANTQLKANQAELRTQNEDLRQTKTALEESRGQFVNLYEFAPVAYLTLSPEGVVHRINNTGASLLGLRLDRITGRSFSSFVAPDGIERWAHFLELSARGGERQRDEFALVHDDGTVFFVNAESSPSAPPERRTCGAHDVDRYHGAPAGRDGFARQHRALRGAHSLVQ